jgi:NAD(P)-dependent dehydrogenase (short-subunit alcohol dehydrogenase family)
MTAAGTTGQRPVLAGQTVVVIGGSAGIGLETARRARAKGADVVVTGRNVERLKSAAVELGATISAAFDVNDPDALERFFSELPEQVDHVMITAGRPHYALLADIDVDTARRALDEQLRVPIDVARYATAKVRPGGSLVFMSGTGARLPAPGLMLTAIATAAMPVIAANLALELAPIRVNVVAAGFIDTPLSAALLGADLDKRRDELRSTLPSGAWSDRRTWRSLPYT